MESLRNIVGPRVVRLRSQRNWSQEEMAAKCQRQGWDVSRGVVARIEGGIRWVSDFELLELARVLGVSVGSLYPEKFRKYFRE